MNGSQSIGKAAKLFKKMQKQPATIQSFIKLGNKKKQNKSVNLIMLHQNLHEGQARKQIAQ